MLLLVTTACGRSPQQVVLTAEMPLHLEDHLDAATFTEMISAADVSNTNVKTPVEWRFDQAQPDWKGGAAVECAARCACADADGRRAANHPDGQRRCAG